MTTPVMTPFIPKATPRRRFLATLCGAIPCVELLRAAGASAGESTTLDSSGDVARSAIGAPESAWESLFDGRTLGSWKPTAFGGEGAVTVEESRIVLATGNDLTGITWAGAAPPTRDYEIAVSAMRLSGSDFFCGLTFPVHSSFCSFIVGGWSGTIVGLSNLDNLDASENETTTQRLLDDKRWYAVRVRVTADQIEGWLDEERVVQVKVAGRKIGVRPEVADSRPLGIASYRTRAALRDIRLRRL